MRKIRYLDVSRLRELFSYDPITHEMRKILHGDFASTGVA